MFFSPENFFAMNEGRCSMHVKANKAVRLKYIQSTESNTTNSRLFVDSFIAVTQPDHLMSLKINV